MAKFAIFDACGTLVSDAKDVSDYVAESIRNIYGVIVKVDLSRYEGCTAKEIARLVLNEYGIMETEIDPRLDRYMEDLPYSYYNVAWSDRIVVSEGAKTLLDELRENGALLGIATGDSEKVTRMRLRKAGLDSYFAFGSYGEESEDMGEIIGMAVKRAVSGSSLPVYDGIFISGSPKTVKAAKETGIFSIGCMLGRHDASDFQDAKPDLMIKTFREKRQILKTLFK